MTLREKPEKRVLSVTQSLFLVLALTGCKPAPMTNTIIDKRLSPDGHSYAILVERYRHAALNANIFYVVVAPRGEDVANIINNENIEASAAIVATKANRLKLSWENQTTVRVQCDACGIEAIDIMKKVDHSGGYKFFYVGLPEHTAYS
jgi:hypothetical protein